MSKSGKTPIEAPEVRRERSTIFSFLPFSVAYYTVGELEKSGKTPELPDLQPVFDHYEQHNVGLAEDAIRQISFEYLQKFGVVEGSNRFISHFARQHLKKHIDPKFLYDSKYVKMHPNGFYVNGSAYVILTEDYRFMLKNFQKEERRLMFNLMNLYQDGFPKRFDSQWNPNLI